jgi:hypothetical protein
MLYLVRGDVVAERRSLGSGQNLDSLLGKILRLDVRTLPYRFLRTIPSSASREASRDLGVRRSQSLALRLRRRDASLYIADVGQDSREEVNVVAANAPGLNYRWNVWEGTMCYPSGNACSAAGITMPVLDYDHGNGCSITGGYVYRGAALPEVVGRYFYSDFCNGWLRSFLVVNGVATERLDWHITPIGSIQSFGVDSRNELYALTSERRLYKLVRIELGLPASSVVHDRRSTDTSLRPSRLSPRTCSPLSSLWRLFHVNRGCRLRSGCRIRRPVVISIRCAELPVFRRRVGDLPLDWTAIARRNADRVGFDEERVASNPRFSRLR